jgi:LCP family protein required for cell wall assembly
MALTDQPARSLESSVDDEETPLASGGFNPLPAIGRLFLLALVVLGGFIGAALVLTPPRASILILGSDARPDETARGVRGRTDTMMVLVADRAAPLFATVSVPRDLWVTIAGGHGDERINAAFELGGSQVAMQTVSSTLGQPVDRYALIGLQGVRDVVDALGGIDITVATPIHDDAYPTDDYGVITIDIPVGRQHMDGETALQYARTRHQDNDFARAARQQQVLAAVKSQLANPATWPRLPEVAAAVWRSVETNVSPLDAVAIGAAALRSGGDPDRLVIDTRLARVVTGDEGAYLLQATPELKPTVARFLGTAPTNVEVLNGAGVAGAARSAADRLAGQGFDVSHIGNADRAQPQTTLSARPQSRSVAEAIAGALGVPADRVSGSANLPVGVDVRVIVGSDLANR